MQYSWKRILCSYTLFFFLHSRVLMDFQYQVAGTRSVKKYIYDTWIFHNHVCTVHVCDFNINSCLYLKQLTTVCISSHATYGFLFWTWLCSSLILVFVVLLQWCVTWGMSSVHIDVIYILQFHTAFSLVKYFYIL